MNRLGILRRAPRLVAVLTLLIAALAASVVIAEPAHAAGPCGTLGHSYLITQSGSVNISGCQGDLRFGVGTINLRRFDVISLAGNRIRPGTPITWTAFRPDGVQEEKVTTNAGGNTVVRQEPNTYFFNGFAPPGTWAFFASYEAANGVDVDFEHVVNVQLGV